MEKNGKVEIGKTPSEISGSRSECVINKSPRTIKEASVKIDDEYSIADGIKRPHLDRDE